MAEQRTDLRIADATVTVEGILSEKTLEQVKDANGRNVIRGNIVLKIDDTNFITLNVYTNELTNKGGANKAYSNMKAVLETYKSIAEVGETNADIINCNKGNLRPNSYIGKDDLMVHTNVRYNASFIKRINRADYCPQATFAVEGYINTLAEEVDKEGDLTGRVKIGLYVPTYKGIEPLELIADQDKADNFMSVYEIGETAKFYGNIINRNIVKEKVIKMAVGGTRTEVTRQYINELSLTGGDDPYQDEKAYPSDVIKKALVDRDLRLDEEKTKMGTSKKLDSYDIGQGTTARTLPKFTL